MTTSEYALTILQVKKDTRKIETKDEASAYEIAQLVSGSFTSPLYEVLWENFYDMDAITEHLENMYDSGNHFGLVYFTFILANAVDFLIPIQFTEMSANESLVPILSAAIIEDWLEYDSTCEATEYEG